MTFDTRPRPTWSDPNCSIIITATIMIESRNAMPLPL